MNMRKLCLAILLGCFSMSLFAQPTFPVNGVSDERETTYAFKNATIVKDAQNTLTNATMIVRNGKIIAIGTAVTIPADAIVVDDDRTDIEAIPAHGLHTPRID